jgi:hypothetical protein
MHDLNYLLLVSRWIHLSAAILAIGGAAFMLLALLPSAKSTLDDEAHQRLREAVRKRWAPWVHTCIALLLITGATNFLILALPPRIKPMPYHAIFGVKFLMALGIFFLATALVGRSPGFATLRENSRTWLGAILLLAAIIVLLSGLLSQVRLSSQPQNGDAPSVSAVTRKMPAAEPTMIAASIMSHRPSRCRWPGATMRMAGRRTLLAKPTAHATSHTAAQHV